MPEPVRLRREPLAGSVRAPRIVRHGRRPRRVLRRLLLEPDARDVRSRSRQPDGDVRPRRADRHREEPLVGPPAVPSGRCPARAGGRLRGRGVRRAAYARIDVDGTETPPVSRAERRQQATADTRTSILEAARSTLLAVGYANLSTRAVAEAAEVPLSQIHYHFGSKQLLILAVLGAENDRLLARQRSLYAGPEPLWRQWDRACDYLDEDLESGYVRVLQEMIAAGWSDPEVAAAVRGYVRGWYSLLADVAAQAAE